MRAVLFPDHCLSVSADSADECLNAAFATAVLLYSDRVTIAGSFLPYGQLGRTLMAKARVRSIAEATTSRRSAYGILTRGVVTAVEQAREFRERADCLFKEGLLVEHELGVGADIFAGSLDVHAIIDACLEDTEYVAAKGLEKTGIVDMPMSTGTILDGFWALTRMGESPGEERVDISVALRMGLIHSVLTQVRHARELGDALVASHPAPFIVAQRALRDRVSSPRDDYALNFFREGLLATTPAIIPRSFDSVLELRHHLRDDLADFRATLRSIADDLTYEKGEAAQLLDIQAKARRELATPLRNLKRQLGSPGRRIARHLVGGMLPGSIVTLAAAGGLLPAVGTIGVLAGVVLGTVTAYLEEDQLIRSSPAAFLFRAERRFRV